MDLLAHEREPAWAARVELWVEAGERLRHLLDVAQHERRAAIRLRSLGRGQILGSPEPLPRETFTGPGVFRVYRDTAELPGSLDEIGVV